MKTIYYSVFLMFLFSILTSCGGDDEKKTEGNFDSKQFQGEWCSISGSTATIFAIANNTFSGEVYTNLATAPMLYETLSGTWGYYPTNDMLQMEVMHSRTLEQVTNSYKVLKADNRTLQLREQSTGSVDDYYKLLGTITIEAGNSTMLTYQEFSPTGYQSTNSSIVTIDSRGVLTAKEQGTAFISMFSDDAIAIVKVIVNGRIDKFVTELKGTIDEVLMKYGTPDVTGEIGQNKAVLYKTPSSEPSLSRIQYQFDESTREVSRILTVYQSPSVFNADKEFVKNSFIDHGSNLYGPFTDFGANPYFISPFTESGVNYISYNNQEYHNRTGHY